MEAAIRDFGGQHPMRLNPDGTVGIDDDSHTLEHIATTICSNFTLLIGVGNHQFVLHEKTQYLIKLMIVYGAFFNVLLGEVQELQRTIERENTRVLRLNPVITLLNNQLNQTREMKLLLIPVFNLIGPLTFNDLIEVSPINKAFSYAMVDSQDRASNPVINQNYYRLAGVICNVQTLRYSIIAAREELNRVEILNRSRFNMMTRALENIVDLTDPQFENLTQPAGAGLDVGLDRLPLVDAGLGRLPLVEIALIPPNVI